MLFVVSLLPYLWLLWSVVDAFFNGTTSVFFSVYVEPGLEAVEQVIAGALIASVAFPVFPICLLFQVLFLVLYFKNK